MLLRANHLLRSYCKNNVRLVHLSAPQWRKVTFNLSDIGEGIRDVVIKEWFVKEGDVVEQFDNLCEVQSDKASVTITSRYDGRILKLHHGVDDTALVGKSLIDFDVDDIVEQLPHEDHTLDKTLSSLTDDNTPSRDTFNKDLSKSIIQKNMILATPAVRRIASENNINLLDVKASGRDGRVLKSDILEYLNLVPSTITEKLSEHTKQITKSPDQITDVGFDNCNRTEKLKDIRKIMFKTMTQSLRIPHFTYSDEVDITNLVRIRNSLKIELENKDVKITFMPFFIKAASLALLKYPILNSSIDETTESIVYKPSHNISVAMATANGLVVPNIKNCERKTIVDIARDLNSLQHRGQNGQLTPEDFANGTFSVSNIGVVGGTYTQPCIVPPQVAIGAIGTKKVVPRFDENGAIIQMHLVHVSWSADHRIIDGVTMASYSNEWKRYVEQPERFIWNN